MLEARPANRSATVPKSPGAAKSPQRPGQTPDRSTIPTQYRIQAPEPLGPPIRPAVQYLSAQELSNAMPVPTEPAEPSDFEQAPASFEESRKAYPWQTPPRRPTPWFTLGDGVATSDPALAAGAEGLALEMGQLAAE
jgi:hypothetical protein